MPGIGDGAWSNQRISHNGRMQCLTRRTGLSYFAARAAVPVVSSNPGARQEVKHPEVEVLRLTPSWVAVNKPAGMLVHRTKLYNSAAGEEYLVDVVAREVERNVGHPVKLFPVQRLDRPTSGVILFALQASQNASRLQQVLQSKESRKEYWLLAFGSDMPETWVNENPLRDMVGRHRKQRRAYSEFEQLLRLEQSDISVVRAYIETGRRHQIRRHLSNSRHPVVGDTSHGKGEQNRMSRERYGVTRCCIHSRRVTFLDPEDDEKTTIEAPVPQDLRDVLERIPDYNAAIHCQEVDLGDLPQ